MGKQRCGFWWNGKLVYANVKHDIGADVKENVVIENASLSSQVLSGPQGSPSTSVVKRPWSGRLCERESPNNS